MLVSPFLALTLFFATHRVMSFPTGAGGCSGVNGSVGDLHLEGPILITGSLATSQLAVVIEEAGTATTAQAKAVVNALQEGGTSEIDVGKEYIIKMFAEGIPEFEGFLFRLASKQTGVDTSMYLTPSDMVPNSQLAEVCLAMNIAGVTHKAKEVVTNVTTNMMVDEPMDLELQVTAVTHNGYFPNGTHHSEFYHSTYNVKALGTGNGNQQGNNNGGNNNGNQQGNQAPTGTPPAATSGVDAIPLTPKFVGGTILVVASLFM